MDITALACSLSTVLKEPVMAHYLQYALILYTLKYNNGHRSKTARALGISRRTLTNKIAEMRVISVKIPDPSNTPK